MSDLRTILLLSRMKLKDLGVKRFTEIELIAAANEGKNELAKIIRQAREDFFYKTATGTFSTTTAPNYSEITLPADFSQLKDIEVTTAGYEWTEFAPCDISDPRFKEAARYGGSYGGGSGTAYYDVVGNTKVVFAPGFDVALDYRMRYISVVPDLRYPTDTIAPIPLEHFDYIVTYVVAECMREGENPAYQLWLDKLERQKDMIVESINTVQIRDPKYVRGYMEEEGW
jgi:hypothetical protein